MESSELLNVMFMLNQMQNKNFLQVIIMVIFMYFKTIGKYLENLHIFNYKNLTYEITGNYSYKNNVIYLYDFSHQLLAVLHDLITRLAQDNNQNYSIQEVYIGGTQKEIVRFIHFNNKNSYEVNSNIQIRTKSKEDISIKEDGKNITYELSLISTRKNMNDIYNYIDTCIESYDLYMKSQLKNQFAFIFDGIKKNENSTKIHKLEYQEYPFTSTKTFDNMFFEKKNELIKRIDYFTTNKDIYQRLGIPYTFGMLFHGPPGCGKTSAIKAIANYTKRHVIVLPVKKIKSIETLKQIFLNTSINSYYIPNDKRLYVFEEIDCGQWRNVVLDRTLKEQEDAAAASVVIPTIDPLKTTALVEKEKPEEVTINLGEFLELLDGIIEIPGRMMIISSNRPDILDAALLRPGRIDFNMEFTKMTREDVKRMYYLWFNENIPKHICDVMKDYMFSQAEVGMIFSKICKKEIYKCLAA